MPLCPCCHANLKRLIKRRDKYTLLSCSNCSFITSFPLPSKEELQKFYQGCLFNAPKDEEETITALSLLNNTKRIVSDLNSYVITGKKLLDCGGGMGYYAQAFSRLGYEVTMIDVDSHACRYAKTTYPGRFKVVCGDAITQYFDEKFDIIFCNQLIEHYPDPDFFLQSLKSKITKNGVIIITTPNQGTKEFFFRPKWFLSYIYMVIGLKLYRFPKALYLFLKTPWLCCDPPRHLHSFNKKNISVLFENNSLRSIKIITEYSLYQYYSPKKYRDFKIKKFSDLIKILLNVYAHLGITLLKILDTKNNFGSNLVAYCKRKI